MNTKEILVTAGLSTVLQGIANFALKKKSILTSTGLYFILDTGALALVSKYGNPWGIPFQIGIGTGLLYSGLERLIHNDMDSLIVDFSSAFVTSEIGQYVSQTALKEWFVSPTQALNATAKQATLVALGDSTASASLTANPLLKVGTDMQDRSSLGPGRPLIPVVRDSAVPEGNIPDQNIEIKQKRNSLFEGKFKPIRQATDTSFYQPSQTINKNSANYLSIEGLDQFAKKMKENGVGSSLGTISESSPSNRKVPTPSNEKKDDSQSFVNYNVISGETEKEPVWICV